MPDLTITVTTAQWTRLKAVWGITTSAEAAVKIKAWAKQQVLESLRDDERASGVSDADAVIAAENWDP